MPTKTKPSPNAAQQLSQLDISSFDEFEQLMGETDCPDGCYVEPDGICPHGYLSAGRTAGVI